MVNKKIKILKEIISKNELQFLYFFLALSIFNNVSHFVRKNIFGDRIDFWDFHVYWCSANKFINGMNPYNSETIKECLSQFNFELHFAYPPIVLNLLSSLGKIDLFNAKIIWIIIVLSSFSLIIFYLKKIYEIPRIFFFTLILIFTGGGLIWGALLAGNISVILYAILTISIYYILKKKFDIYYILISIISLVKFPFLIFFLMPIFLYGFKEIKKCIFYLLITFFFYYLQFYLDKSLFLDFINSTKTYKGEDFLIIHGTGIGIHGIIDLYQNLLYEKTNFSIFNPYEIYAFSTHIFISCLLLFSSFFLFEKKKINLKQSKLLVSFFIVIFLCCFPRISSYDFFLIISSYIFIAKNSRIRSLSSNWNFFICLLTISILAMYDSKYPAFAVSIFIFICFYLQIKKKDPFYLKKI